METTEINSRTISDARTVCEHAHKKESTALSYIEYFSLARVEQATVDSAEDQVECQPDQIPESAVNIFSVNDEIFRNIYSA